jgi:hypothetical protein
MNEKDQIVMNDVLDFDEIELLKKYLSGEEQ